MKIKVASEVYMEKAKLLSDEETERVLSRMGGKLRRRKDKEKVNCLEALAIQLEIEDEMLKEWRERFAEVKANHDKKEAKSKLAAVPEPPQEQSKVEPKAKPQRKPKAKKPE